MNIVHLNTSDISGGAARAAYRLHQGLRGIGVDSSMYVRNKTSKDEYVQSYDATAESPLQRIRDKLFRRWLNYRYGKYQQSIPNKVDLFSQDRTVNGRRVVEKCPNADIYNLHWINKFVDPLHFFKVTNAPVVWTLHDMNPLTGGCHVNAGCHKFEHKCGACPQLGSDKEYDLSRKVWERKWSAYHRAVEKDKRLHIVAISKYMAKKVEASSLLAKAPLYTIPHGLNHNVFRPTPTEGLKNALGIPKQHQTILFVADYGTRVKGFDLLSKALSNLETKRVTLLSIGSGNAEENLHLSHKHIGRISNDNLLAVMYSFADVFVIPSRQESFGQTALESMACGTPVVGFDIGGIPDIVRPGKTGWLAEPESVRSLSNAIETALSNEEARARMGKECRNVVEREYTLDVQANAYRDLYRKLIESQKDTRTMLSHSVQ